MSKQTSKEAATAALLYIAKHFGETNAKVDENKSMGGLSITVEFPRLNFFYSKMNERYELHSEGHILGEFCLKCQDHSFEGFDLLESICATYAAWASLGAVVRWFVEGAAFG